MKMSKHQHPIQLCTLTFSICRNSDTRHVSQVNIHLKVPRGLYASGLWRVSVHHWPSRIHNPKHLSCDACCFSPGEMCLCICALGLQNKSPQSKNTKVFGIRCCDFRFHLMEWRTWRVWSSRGPR